MTEGALESGEGKDFLLRIKRSLEKTYEIVRKAKTLDGMVPSIFDMKVFTDNIVVAYPLRNASRDLGEPELGTLLMLFAEVQASLAFDGFLLRGAIALGDHYQDDDIAYGEALLEAVDLDKSGGPPRLVIGSSLEHLIAAQLESYGDGGWAPHHDCLKIRVTSACSLTTYKWRLNISPTARLTISFSQHTGKMCVEACVSISQARVSVRSPSGWPPITTTFATHSLNNLQFKAMREPTLSRWPSARRPRAHLITLSLSRRISPHDYSMRSDCNSVSPRTRPLTKRARPLRSTDE